MVGVGATLATTEVHVEPGDTVSELAVHHGVSMQRIVEANDLDDPDHILVGDVLIIPDDATPEVAPEAPPAQRVYVVEPGDTLSEIAVAHGTSTAALTELNGLADPDRIRSGFTLTLTGAEPTETAEAATPAEPAGTPAPAVASEAPAAARITYVVRSGDTLAGIAARFGMATDVLAAVNSISDIDLVVEGQQLSVPPRTVDADAFALLPERIQVSPARLALIPVFDLWAGEYGIDPALFKAMTWVESGWQSDIVSSAGAVGIGQLMPATVEHMNEVLGTSLDPTVPVENIRMSARFLAFLLDRTDGDVRLALAAYHQGLTSVRTDGVYRSSENYVSATLALSARF